MERKSFPTLLALIGTVIVFAGQTGPDEALANFGRWLEAVGLGGLSRWLAASGAGAWLTAFGAALIGAAVLLWWRRSRAGPANLPRPGASEPKPAPSTPGGPAVPSNPILLQVDALIDRLERANQAYAGDPDGFYKKPGYAKLRVQISELDDLAAAVKAAVRRKYGAGSAEDGLAASALDNGLKWTSPGDDAYFRDYVDWLVRIRGVATLLG